ncbi:MAG: 50S ribosomal protein L6 [bacterium]|nr:50S ribosomal protein L6 [bacterium]
MSRIGKKPIIIPENVQLELNHKIITKGPLGDLSLKLPREIRLEKKENVLLVLRKSETKQAKSLHGLIRSLIANMVEGVTAGFKKTLELSGIGFRANLVGDKLVMTLGYSHLVEIEPPIGINFAVAGNKITVSGIDKELVGRIAAKIRSRRPPDAYKGKGIRYEGEKIRLKPGKAAKAGVATGS